MTLFFCTCMGINMTVLLNKDGENIGSAISLEMPTRGLIKVRISHHIHRDKKSLTSRSASPIALVDA
jgi:RNA-binding protein YhbY